jgi:hypothetical protein
MVENTTFNKLNKYKNLYLNRVTDTLYELQNGEFKEIKYGAIILKAENPTMSMDERLAAMDEKIKSGEIVCSIDSPDDCEACGS